MSGDTSSPGIRELRRVRRDLSSEDGEGGRDESSVSR